MGKRTDRVCFGGNLKLDSRQLQNILPKWNILHFDKNKKITSNLFRSKVVFALVSAEGFEPATSWV